MTETIEQIALRVANEMWLEGYPTFHHSVVHFERCLAELAKKQEPAGNENIRQIVEAAIVEHCNGGDLVMCSLLAAKKIACAYSHPATPRPVVSPDFAADAHRLALELECLLLSSKDTAAVSAWWDSAHEALEQHRALCAEITEPKATDVEDRKDAERLKEQRDALLNAAIDAVYQMRRYDFTSGRLILLEAIQEATGDTEATITARREGE